MRIFFLSSITILLSFFSFVLSTSFAKENVTTDFLTSNEKLVYKGSAPRLGLLGKGIGFISLNTVEDKLVSGEKCFKINLSLELSKSISGIYQYGAALSSVLDSRLFRSLIYYKNDQKGDESRFEKAVIDYDGHKIYYRKYGKGQTGSSVEIEDAHSVLLDPLSLIYYLRTLVWDKKVGQSEAFYLFNRGKVAKVVIDYQLVDQVISGQKVQVIHIKPSAATKGALISKRDVELFLDPQTKIPLMIKILGIPVVGKLELVLIESNHKSLQIIPEESK